MKYFAGDFCDREAALRFAARQLDASDAAWLLENLARVKIRHSPYDWTIAR